MPSLLLGGHTMSCCCLSFHRLPLTSNSKSDSTFYHTIRDYSRADWDGLRFYLRDVLLEDIFELGPSLLPSFVSGSRFKLMYISLIVNIKSSLIHHHGFQLLMQLPQFIEIIFFIFAYTINTLYLRSNSDRLLTIAKGFLELQNLLMLIKQNLYHSPEFWLFLIVFSVKVNLLHLLYIMVMSCLYD